MAVGSTVRGYGWQRDHGVGGERLQPILVSAPQLIPALRGEIPNVGYNLGFSEVQLRVVIGVVPVYQMHCRDEDWLEEVLVGLRHVGLQWSGGRRRRAVGGVPRRDVLCPGHHRRGDRADRTMQAGELPGMMLCLLFQTEPIFVEFIALPEVLAVIDATVGDAAILHQQNGVALAPAESEAPTETFQNRFHQDFRPGMVASVCMFFALDTFSPQNGSTFLVPGSHQQLEAPDHAIMDRNNVLF